MTANAAVAALLCVLVSVPAFGQGRGTPPPPATETVAPDIPGVVAGGTNVLVIKEGFQRAPQNLAFAGPDKKTLYVVGRGAAFKIQLLAQGFKGRAK